MGEGEKKGEKKKKGWLQAWYKPAARAHRDREQRLRDRDGHVDRPRQTQEIHSRTDTDACTKTHTHTPRRTHACTRTHMHTYTQMRAHTHTR